MAYNNCIRLFVLSSVLAYGQGLSDDSDHFLQTAQQLNSFTPQEVDTYLLNAIIEKLPATAVDSLVYLATNRETLVLPMLAASAREQLDEKTRNKLVDIITYLGTPVSITTLLQLIENDPQRAREWIPKTLAYAYGRRNPIDLAYQIVQNGIQPAKDAASDWVSNNVSTQRMLDAWAQFLLARHKGYVPDFELNDDPIAGRLDEDKRVSLRRSIEEERLRRFQQNTK